MVFIVITYWLTHNIYQKQAPKMKKKKTAVSVQRQPQNKPKTIKTSDNKEFKVIDVLLMKYSLLFKTLIQDQKNDDQVITLHEIDSEAFEIINEFMQLHKDKDVSKIELPLKSNQELKYVLDEGDALLVEKIMARGDDYFLKIFQAASFLQVEELKKRLIAGLAIKLMKSTVDEMKKDYDLQQYDLKEEEIREEAQKRLKFISEMKEEQ